MINLDDRILEKLNENELWILMHYAKRMRSNRLTAWPSIRTLAKDCNWSVNTTQKWRDSLVSKGIIKDAGKKGDTPIFKLSGTGIGIYTPIDEYEMEEESVSKIDTPVSKIDTPAVSKIDTEVVLTNYKNINKEEGETRAQKMRVQIFDPVKEETFEINGCEPAEPDIFAERSKSPGSKTADDLFGKMQQYYKVFQNEWAVGIMDFARASKYSKEQRTEILKKWAAHQIKNNSGSDTFGMLHASLQKWFMDQRQFEPKDQQEKTQRITLEFNQ